jgi:hypothetical protein
MKKNVKRTLRIDVAFQQHVFGIQQKGTTQLFLEITRLGHQV